MRMLSLFSGIGGIDLAAQLAGIETVAFCEIEPFCQKVLAKHWPGVPIFNDVETINKQQLIEQGVIGDGRPIDIICGGYPCQPFSNAGQRLGEEDDRHLWPEMLRLIKELRPTWVLGENVDGHVTLGLDTVLANLEEEGYTTRAFVIPAAAVYAPHQRKRVFVVGYSERGRCGGQSRGRSGTLTQNGYSQMEEGNVANTKSDFTRGLSFGESKEKSGFACGSQNVAHSTSERCGEAWGNHGYPGQRESIKSSNQESSRERQTGQLINVCFGSEWAAQSGMGGNLDGLSDWLDRFRWPAAMGLEQYEWEPSRVITGMKGKVREARLKSLGNAVNPVQVLPIMWAMKQVGDKII